jgi:acetyl esterase/lipase
MIGIDSKKLCTCCSQVVTSRPLCSAVLTSHRAVASCAAIEHMIIVSISGFISHSRHGVSGTPTSVIINKWINDSRVPEVRSICAMVRNLVRNADDVRHPYVTPMNVPSHCGLPPAAVVTNGFDHNAISGTLTPENLPPQAIS